MKPMRAVIWCAVSTKAQAEEDKESLPEQEKQARALCAERGWQIVDVLRVPGHSRNYFDFNKLKETAYKSKQKIDAFYKIEEHWEKGDFDVLVVRDGDRFARTQSLHAYFTERTILEAKAIIWSFADGEINQTNYSGWTALSGYKASNENREKVKKYHMGFIGRAKRGLPGSPRPPGTHVLVRDPKTGRATELVVDESKRKLFDDLAELVLAGVSYDGLEPELFKRGHISSSGKRLHVHFAYRLLWNPPTWGNMARGYRKREHKQSTWGAWIWDPSCPPPDGVEIFYNVVPPVYEGELARRLQAELLRRSEAIKGSARPHNTYKFTGLVICDACGFSMGLRNRKDSNYRYLYCPCGKNKRYSYMPDCSNKRVINEKEIQKVFDRYLRAYVAARQGNPELHAQMLDGLILDSTPTVDTATVKTQLEDARGRARIVIRQQINAPAGLQDIYQEELTSINAEIERLQAQLGQLERQAAMQTQQQSERVQAIADLPDEVDEFWTWETRKINQLLHRFMGENRLAVRDGRVVQVKPSPFRKQ